MLKIIIPVLLFLMVILGGKILSANKQTHQSPQVTEVTESPSKEHMILSRMVDSRGADIAVGHVGTPIDGLVVHIPPGAMEQADRITLSYSIRSVPLQVGTASGLIVTLQADTIKTFLGPVRVEMHYPAQPRQTVAIPYLVDASGRLHILQLVKFYEASSTIVFDTFVPGDFTLVYDHY